MEKINCIFCDKDNANVFIEENGFKGRKCTECNLIYISPRPTLDEIINLYGHDNANISAEAHIKDSYTKTLYAKHHLDIIKKYTSEGKLLEIGAGAGYFLKEAKKQGFKVFGIEFNNVQAKFINEDLYIPCEQLPLSKKTFGDEKFNVIYHCDVISHYYHPIEEFEKTNLKLKDDGYVIFETGNLGDVDEKYLKYYKRFQYPDHLFFYSEENIKTLLEKTGFELVKIYRYSIVPQLSTDKSVSDFIRKVKGGGSTNGDVSEEKKPSTASKSVPEASSKNSRVKSTVKKWYAYFFYLLRYKAGAIAPKKGKPQTILVIGRKKQSI